MFDRIRAIFHGKGADQYKTIKAKEAYADSLRSTGDHCFTLTLAPLAGAFISPESVNMIVIAISCSAFLCSGLWLRHEALNLLDDLELKRESRAPQNCENT